MVGVPKSKGCKTCRARKLKCDQQKPSCDRCVRTGRQCGGYEKEMLWKNSFASTADGKSSRSVAAYSETVFQSKTSVINFYIPPREVRNGPSYQLQFLSLFLTSYMPQGEDSTVPTSGKMPLIVWPHRLPGMLGRSSVVDSAVNAMVTSYLGVARQDTRLMKESLPLYTVAIRNVYNATMKAHHLVAEDILSAIMAMTMFEMFLSTTTGWMSHVQGGAALLWQCGPPTSDNPINSDLLRRFRSLIICDSIGRRKRTFLEEPEWQKLNGPHPYDDLLDIISCIPGLLEEVDCLTISTMRGDNGEIRRALNRCLDLERRMQEWSAALQHSVSNVLLFWREPRHRDSGISDENLDMDQLFPYRVCFPTLRLAQLHQFYWATSTEIYMAMEELLVAHERIQQLTSDFFTPSLESLLPPLDSPMSRSTTQISTLATYYADLCCQAQDYICSSEFGAVGPQSTLAAMGIVKMFYERHDTRKFRWCRRELEKLVGRGFGAAKLLSTMTREDYANLGKVAVLGSEQDDKSHFGAGEDSTVDEYTEMPIRKKEEQTRR